MKKLIVLAFSLVCSLSASAASYQDYDAFLKKKWEIPISESRACGKVDASHWMKLANSMISLAPVQKNFKLNDDEIMVLKNLLISQAYNRLFYLSLERQNTLKPKIGFIWIAAGSQASVTVGHALQNGLADDYYYSSRQYYVFSRLRNLYEPLDPIPSVLLNTIKLIKKKTAMNNWRVFDDIYWQHLAYLNCGLNEVLKINGDLAVNESRLGNQERARHYRQFQSVWRDMDEGLKAKNGNDLLMQANIKLIEIEQYNILQKHMYDGIDAQLASFLLLFNSMAEAELAGPGGRRIMGFTEYSVVNRRYPNLADYSTRFPWMKYVVSEQAMFLRELGTKARIGEVIKKSLYESVQLVKDYEDLAKTK